ncbi:MAG: InlB B-repeat-containing protein, partial [Dehalococcoidia bacterium]|nr:InlB B-repeat-containing protein [Dehalococcoidia bacterium]
IAGNKAGGNGGGVYVSGIGSIFNMVNSEISGNRATMGGGICNAGIFNMDSGNISDNTATFDGIVYDGDFLGGGGVLNNGTFNMNGGTIHDNESKYSGGGVFNSAIFIMSGGIIFGNKVTNGNGGGVFNGARGTFAMNTGAISDNEAGLGGGGVYNRGIFAMFFNLAEGTSGRVSNNKSSYGGGVCNIGTGTIGVFNPATGIFSLEAGEVSGNEAVYQGGGIYNSGGTMAISGGTISNNKAEKGGGVYEQGILISSGEAYSPIGTISMVAGEILGNTAVYGGGVAIDQYGTFFMDGGAISGNIATRDGGGVYTQDYTQLAIGAKSVFFGNSAETYIDFRDPIYDAVYESTIYTDNWTTPFTQGYNNYDINNIGALSATVTFYLNDGTGEIYATRSAKAPGYGPLPSLDNDMPPDPTRKGYVFKYWYTIGNAWSDADRTFTTFTPYFGVDSDISVYAHWLEAATPPTETIVTMQPSDTQTSPTTTAGTLFPEDSIQSWAPLNLVLGIVGALLAALTGIKAFFRRQRVAVHLGWSRAVMFLGIAGVVVFFLTNNMSNKVSVINIWTLLNTGILAAEIVGLTQVFRQKDCGSSMTDDD